MELTRDEKCINLIRNMGIITLSVATINMTEALSDMMKKYNKSFGGAFVMAVSDKKDWDAVYEKNVKSIPPDILAVIKDTKKQIDEQQSENPEGLKKFASNPRFDEGINIVEKYKSNIPKITEPIDEKALAIYVALILSGDKKISPMFKELNDLVQG